MTDVEIRPLESHARAARRLGFELLWDDEIVGRFGTTGKIRRFTVRLEPKSAETRAAMAKASADGTVMAIESKTVYRSDDDRLEAIEQTGKGALETAFSVLA